MDGGGGGERQRGAYVMQRYTVIYVFSALGAAFTFPSTRKVLKRELKLRVDTRAPQNCTRQQ